MISHRVVAQRLGTSSTGSAPLVFRALQRGFRGVARQGRRSIAAAPKRVKRSASVIADRNCAPCGVDVISPRRAPRAGGRLRVRMWAGNGERPPARFPNDRRVSTPRAHAIDGAVRNPERHPISLEVVISAPSWQREVDSPAAGRSRFVECSAGENPGQTRALRSSQPGCAASAETRPRGREAPRRRWRSEARRACGSSTHPGRPARSRPRPDPTHDFVRSAHQGVSSDRAASGCPGHQR